MKKRGERILGPYEQPKGWRVIEIDALGVRSSSMFDSEERARRYIEIVEAQLSQESHTTATALAAYLKHRGEEGTKEESLSVVEWAIGLFFPEPVLLSMLSAKRCQKLYDDLRARKSERTGKTLSVDTHRNARDRVSCFLSWCVQKGWLAENPVRGGKVRGVGKRRPRGKSLGKDGNRLNTKQARLWYAKALELARAGDQGAVASLCALLLGLRANEIVKARIGDLDDVDAPCDVLHVPDAKSEAGVRDVEIPEVLRELIVASVGNRHPSAYLFVCEQKHLAGKPHTNCWPIDQVQRICDAAGVPRVTAHHMRGLLATITAERGMAGHLIAATLGHESYDKMTAKHYAMPGSAAAGALRRGWSVLNGGAK